MITMASAVYLLCLLTSVVCAVLLLRAWRSGRSRLILWTAVSFGFLALANLMLVADRVLFPEVYLTPVRQAASAVALVVLLYAFIWEADR